MTAKDDPATHAGVAERVLLTLIAPASLGESVADLLLEAPELVSGFTSSAASGHGARLRFEATSERVRGRGRRTRFELVLGRAGAMALLERLRATLGEANIYYWICPMLECGTLGEPAPPVAES
ncbi:MAG: DUF3240 family protein [Burkholderiaceae bacterium]|nr:DUF3240 family protein [Burkholderiaceae bacterium]